jgi:hypothetical protein
MNKFAYFHTFLEEAWPSLEFLEKFFRQPPAGTVGWFPDSGNDSAVLRLEGLDGTEHILRFHGRKDIELSMWGNPHLGVLLQYARYGGGVPRQDWFSQGDMTKLRVWVRSLHDTPLPVGLFIPFEQAWLAVKEFMATEGQLPTAITWVNSADLPAQTFPDPMDVPEGCEWQP